MNGRVAEPEWLEFAHLRRRSATLKIWSEVAAGFTVDELRRIGQQVGAKKMKIETHWPWFRISAVVSPI